MPPSHVSLSLLMPHDDDDDYGKTIIIIFASEEIRNIRIRS